jgi:hypothetical protein
MVCSAGETDQSRSQFAVDAKTCSLDRSSCSQSLIPKGELEKLDAEARLGCIEPGRPLSLPAVEPSSK